MRLEGRVRFPVAAMELRRVLPRVRSGHGRLVLDLGGADSVDGGTLALLVDLRRRLEAGGREVEVVPPPGRGADLLRLLEARPAGTVGGPRRRVGVLDQVGRVAAELATRGFQSLGYVGDVAATAARPWALRFRDVPRLLERAGADGLPIVVVINLLVGVVLGIQGALQLRPYGGDVFVADLVAIVVCRSLGPLMTAIIVAGRSGAAFAAELGTMKVSEEIDALRVMRLDPVAFLVLPRVLAMALAVPALTLLGDAAALFGGLLVGTVQLGIPPGTYLDRTQEALTYAHVFSGLVKSVFFGLTVALVACERGLATRGGAEGVGRATTSAVVTIIFAVVVLEAAFTLLFSVWGV